MSDASPGSEAEPAPVYLRGHHLLCMLTYKGLGYTPAFSDNMTTRIRAIAAGHPIRLVEGPDDLCSALTDGCGHEGHCREERTLQRDRNARAALSGLLPVGHEDGFTIDAALLSVLRHAFAAGTIRLACQDCEWSPLCDSIAANGFSESLLAIR